MVQPHRSISGFTELMLKQSLCCSVRKPAGLQLSSEIVNCFSGVVIVVTGHDAVSEWLVKHAKPNGQWLSKLREENHRTEKFTTLILGNML